jgi:hypothetical protein
MQALRRNVRAHTTPMRVVLVRRLYAAALAGMLIAAAGLAPWPLSWRLPAGPRPAFASAPLEDCDLDGYDDHTGAPVPWAGFDATRGDSIPSGWDGAANSWTGDHTNDGSTSGRAGSGDPSGGSTSANPGGSRGSSTGSRSGAASGAGSATNTGGGATIVNGQPVVVSTAPTATPAGGSPVIVSVPDTGTVLAGRGTIRVADTQGALMHLGGSIRIDGVGFAPFAPGLQIWIDSIPVSRVSADENGAFTGVVRLPAGIAAGAHRVVVRYGASHLAHVRVDVGPRPADSFVRALVVGFSDTNPQRDAGVILLAALGAAGVVAYGSRALMRRPSVREAR